MREEVKMTAEAFGSIFGPAVEGGMKSLEKLAGTLRMVAESPLGKITLVGTAAGGLVSLAGGALLAIPALLKLAAVYTAVRSSMSYGVREGFGGSGRITADRDDMGRRTGGFSGGGFRGQEIANDPRSTWMQRWMYNRGVGAGAPIGSAARSIEAAGWGRADMGKQGALGSFIWPTRPDGGHVTGAQRLGALGSAPMYGGAALLRNFVTPQFDQARFKSVPDRTSWPG